MVPQCMVPWNINYNPCWINKKNLIWSDWGRSKGKSAIGRGTVNDKLDICAVDGSISYTSRCICTSKLKTEKYK